LYGYTEARFRAMNGLQKYQRVNPGTSLLTTDCPCPIADAKTPEQQPVSFQNEEVLSVPVAYNTVVVPAKTTAITESKGSTTDYFDEATTPVNPLEGSSDYAAVTSGTSDVYNTPPSVASASSSNKMPMYMQNEEFEMIHEINLVRSNPTAYIPYVEDYIRDMRQSGEFGNSVSTAYELIEELRRTPILSVLEPMECLYTAARRHGEDQRSTGDVNHQGTDGSYPWDRVLRECPTMRDGNENIVAGPSSIRRAILLLLVDDGIDSRGHRKTLLNPDWRYVACYKIGQVGRMPNFWVQKFGY
jgi:uncharacterized protein YkwD